MAHNIEDLLHSSKCPTVIKANLEKEGFLDYLKKSLWQEISSDHVTTQEEAKESIRVALTSSGLHVQLKNEVYKHVMRLSIRGLPRPFPSHLPDPQDHLTSARMEWRDKLWKSLLAMSDTLKIPLMQMRTESERDKLGKKWNSISTMLQSSNKSYPIYSPKDFLNTLQSIESTNIRDTVRQSGISSNRIIQSRLTYKSLTHLRIQYSSLHPTKFDKESSKPIGGHNAVKSCVICKGSCRDGCPAGIRCKQWVMALGIDTTGGSNEKKNCHSFDRLKSSVLHDHLIIDDVIVKDVRRTAANDVEYFIFEDTMHQVLLTFFRDKDVLAVSTPNNSGSAMYPPNGVVPFHGFSMYVAPLCYLTSKTELVYGLFKQIFMKYFYHLITISHHQQGILGLCELFETLMLSRLPELFHYLVTINCHPLKLVLPWIMAAFSGVVSVEQLLILWDLIIGYDSLELLPLLAVGLLEFRAKTLFQVSSPSEAESALTNFNPLSIVPIMQQLLFL